MIVKCCNCGKEFTLRDAEYKRQLKKGRDWFACCRSCGAVYANTHRTVNSISRKVVDMKALEDVGFKSYYLGFMCADGTLQYSKTGRIHNATVYSTDRQIVDAIAQRFGALEDVKLAKRSNGKTKDLWSFTLYSNNAGYVESLGLCKNKDELTLSNLDVSLYPFLLGFLDGDGTIRVAYRQKLEIVFLGREKLIFEIFNKLTDEGFLCYYTKLAPSPNIPLCQCTLFGKYAERLAKIMYSLSPVHLDRKYRIYTEYLEKY